MSELNKIQEQLFAISFKIGAIKLDTDFPFTWASGYKMPIYNDSRLFLSSPKARKLILKGLLLLLESLKSPQNINNIAGVATGGIAHGVLLAEYLGIAMQYVRSATKSHGLLRQIEGLPNENYNGENVVVIEDVISTGESSLQAMATLRQAGAQILGCLAVYSYAFPKTEEAFAEAQVPCYAILNFPQLLKYIQKQKIISEKEISQLEQWHYEPFIYPISAPTAVL